MAAQGLKYTDFTHGSVARKMVAFAAPLFFSNLLQAVYNMVDMIVVGQHVGKAGLSAVAIGGDIQHLLTFLAIGFSNAGQIVIAQYIGAGKTEDVHLVIGNLFSFLLLASLFFGILGLQFIQPMLSWMNTPVEAWSQAHDYVYVSMCGMVFIYGYNAVSAVLRGMGDSRHPFVFVAVAAVLNAVLDIILVILLDMSAFGAALATVISQGFSFLLGICYIVGSRKNLGLELQVSSFRWKRQIMLPLLRLGFPMAIKNAAIMFSKIFVNSWINSWGVVASSAAGIASKINVIGNLFSNALNVSGSTMIGQNIGAEKYERVPMIMKTIACFGFSTCLTLSGMVVLFPEMVFGIFTSDIDVIDASLRMIPCIVLLFVGSACRSPNNALIDGSGNYRLNFLVAILDGIVFRIGFAVLFGLVLKQGWLGFLYGDALAGFTPLFIGGAYFLSGKWKTRSTLLSR